MSRLVRRLGCVGIGVAAAALALLPWLLTGARLPLQNLWAVQTMPEDMPIALQPLNQYFITTVLALVVTGYGAAGVVVRTLGARLPPRAVLPVGAGLLGLHLVVMGQSTATVAAGLADREESSLYLLALVALMSFALVVGLLVLLLVTARSRAAALIAFSVLAFLVTEWLAALVVALAQDPALTPMMRWLPAVLVGTAIAWCGRGAPGRRLVATACALLVMWVMPAVITAVTSAAGSRVLLRHPAEAIDYGVQVLQAALVQPELALPPLLVACAVAAAGLAVRSRYGRAVPTDDLRAGR